MSQYRPGMGLHKPRDVLKLDAELTRPPRASSDDWKGLRYN